MKRRTVVAQLNEMTIHTLYNESSLLLLLLLSLATVVFSQDVPVDNTFMPRFACEAALQESLFGANYQSSIAPIVTGDFLEVGIQVEVTEKMQISNFGVDGGTVDIFGSLHLNWTDPRLAFSQINNTCDLDFIRVAPETIWNPELAEDVFSAVDWPKATIYRNGSVFWDKLGTLALACRARGTGLIEDPSKICSVSFVEESDGVRYISGGIVVPNTNFSIPEYTVNPNPTTTSNDGKVHLELDFNPLRSDCNLCGHTGARLHTAGSPNFFPEVWLEQFNETYEWNCSQLDHMLQQTVNVSDLTCLMGRAFFEEACCDDTRSTFDCERNIHELLDKENTITPPDPSPKENDTSFSSQDMVDVEVQLDMIHFLGIDVQMNTLKVLVSLKLAWYDPNLAWHPFIGACHRVSYRASLDAEQTEIWVPEIELVNLVEGVHGLPDNHASVRYDGYVRWRRTGIVIATCGLEGIEDFPFDETSCNLEFGGTRDPLYHRVNYVAPKDVQFSSNIADESWNYQEYKVVSSKTEIVIRTDTLSGFENKIIQFQFIFKRARGFYINLFVMLYIIFTYLAFGMFFVDYRLGERLGYGSSMLFVVVAQDITLSGSTPVTQEYLWIYKLSFGSKVFIVYAIVHSIIVLYIYANSVHKSDEPIDAADEEEGTSEEQRPFMEDDGNEEDNADSADDGIANDNEAPQTLTVVASAKILMARQRSAHKERKKHIARKTVLGIKKIYAFLCCLDIQDLKGKHMLKYLRSVDFRMAIICIGAYSLFLVIMFTVGLA